MFVWLRGPICSSCATEAFWYRLLSFGFGLKRATMFFVLDPFPGSMVPRSRIGLPLYDGPEDGLADSRIYRTVYVGSALE